ncbi:hypothetical protein [Azospirillum soli]|uniref:hypothetical protein n=1 Tax=Azospirillum soli TaxID=1304799 RepID=UPI001AE501B8|nr:hypothetical protein [Azospirillum soli]MBP2315543.1 hypothetical protein [Azospirillum soli]
MVFDLSSVAGIYFPVACSLPDGRMLLLPRFADEVEDTFLAAYPPDTSLDADAFARLFLRVLARIPAEGADLAQERIKDDAYQNGEPLTEDEVNAWPLAWVEDVVSAYLSTYTHVFLPFSGRRGLPRVEALSRRNEGESACEHLKRLADALFARTEASVKQSLANLRSNGLGRQAEASANKDPRSQSVKMHLMTWDPILRSLGSGLSGLSSTSSAAGFGDPARLFHRPEHLAPPPNHGLDALRSIQREAAEQRRVQHEQAQALLQMLEETRSQSQQLDALAAALRLLTDQTQRHEALFSGLLQEAKSSSAEAARNSFVAVASLLVGASLAAASLWVSMTSKTDDLLAELVKSVTAQTEELRALRPPVTPATMVEVSKPASSSGEAGSPPQRETGSLGQSPRE